MQKYTLSELDDGAQTGARIQLEALKGLWCINLNINKPNKTASKVEYLKKTFKKHYPLKCQECFQQI